LDHILFRNNYRDFLENVMLLYSENVPLATGGQIWIQNNEALPHFGREVMDT
jgi:hypothetical protein